METKPSYEVVPGLDVLLSPAIRQMLSEELCRVLNQGYGAVTITVHNGKVRFIATQLERIIKQPPISGGWVIE